MESALDQKLDLSALHLGTISLGKLLGALLTLVMSQLFHVFECKSETKNIFTVPYFNNPKLILAVLSSLCTIFAAIYVPFMQIIFSTTALSGQQLAIAFGFAIFAPLMQCLIRNS